MHVCSWLHMPCFFNFIYFDTPCLQIVCAHTFFFWLQEIFLEGRKEESLPEFVLVNKFADVERLAHNLCWEFFRISILNMYLIIWLYSGCHCWVNASRHVCWGDDFEYHGHTLCNKIHLAVSSPNANLQESCLVGCDWQYRIFTRLFAIQWHHYQIEVEAKLPFWLEFVWSLWCFCAERSVDCAYDCS